MSKIYISIGSNVNREKNIRNAISALENEFGEIHCSSVYESEAVGFSGDNFFNLAVAADTNLPVLEVSGVLKGIETANGRIRGSEKFSDRTLDLDLLLYDDLVTEQGVQLPRDEITKNAFVLLPMAEIAAERKHPVEQISYRQMWQAFDQESQKLWKVPFSL